MPITRKMNLTLSLQFKAGPEMKTWLMSSEISRMTTASGAARWKFKSKE